MHPTPQPAPSLTHFPSMTDFVGAGAMPAAPTFDTPALLLPFATPTGLSPAANRVLAQWLRSFLEVLEAEEFEATANPSQ